MTNDKQIEAMADLEKKLGWAIIRATQKDLRPLEELALQVKWDKYDGRPHLPIQEVYEANAWRDISEAPKDGTVIDIWVDGKRCADVHWSFSTFQDGRKVPDSGWDGWAYDGTSGQSYTPNYVRGKGVDATHFMPLTQPPKGG